MDREDFSERLELIINSKNYEWIQNNGLNLIKDIKRAKILDKEELEDLNSIENAINEIKINYWIYNPCRSEVIYIIKLLSNIHLILETDDYCF